jgi:hypothetical protein
MRSGEGWTQTRSQSRWRVAANVRVVGDREERADRPFDWIRLDLIEIELYGSGPQHAVERGDE